MPDTSNEAGVATKKVIINSCYGGFSLSRHAVDRLRELGHERALAEDTTQYWGGYLRDIDRADPLLVQVVEELGTQAAGGAARLTIVEVPTDVDYVVEEHDGLEHVAEKYRTWS